MDCNILRMVFSINGGKATGHPHTKNNNVDTDLIPYRKINSKCFIELNVKCNTYYKPPRKEHMGKPK